jgi:hypothetical protein
MLFTGIQVMSQLSKKLRRTQSERAAQKEGPAEGIQSTINFAVKKFAEIDRAKSLISQAVIRSPMKRRRQGIYLLLL